MVGITQQKQFRSFISLGVFRTQSNTYDRAFQVKIVNGLKPWISFAKKLHYTRSKSSKYAFMNLVEN